MAFDVVTYALCKDYTNFKVSRILEGLSEGMSFKGTVDKIEDLPTSATGGDLYIINEPQCKAVFNSADKQWILFDSIPKKISQLVNDTGYATETWVEDKHYLVEQDIINKADKADLVWEKGEGLNSIITKGNNNQAKGEASVAEGAETDAHSYASHTEGYMTSTGISAEYSHAEGYKTSTQSVASHAEGDSTVTNNPAEHAEGRYNKSNMGGTAATNTIHSIGIGNASGSIPGGERKNAYEIMENGDAYLLGVGDYNGKNPVDAKTLQEVINAKQSKLVAGSGFDINNNNVLNYDPEILSTVEYVDANITDTMNYVIQEDKAEHAGRVAGDNLLQESKQDKLTAGENITIEKVNDKTVISSIGGGKIDDIIDTSTGESVVIDKIGYIDLNAKIGKTFTTNVTVGHLSEGTPISNDMTLADILYRILYERPIGDVIDLYFGASTEIPVDLTGLTKLADQNVPELLANGINRNIVAGDPDKEEGQYPVFACKKDIILQQWSTADFPYPFEFNIVDIGDYYIYYLIDQSYDLPDGINYHFTFKEGR